MESNITRKYRIRLVVVRLINILFIIGPFLYFIPYSLAVGTKVQKLSLSMASMVAMILITMSILLDIKHRASLHKTAFWLTIAGITTCVGSISAIFIWIMAIISIISELILTPLITNYKLKLASNKEIDRRESENIREQDKANP